MSEHTEPAGRPAGLWPAGMIIVGGAGLAFLVAWSLGSLLAGGTAAIATLGSGTAIATAGAWESRRAKVALGAERTESSSPDQPVLSAATAPTPPSEVPTPPEPLTGEPGAPYEARLDEFYGILKEHAGNVIHDTEQAASSLGEGLNWIDGRTKELRDITLQSREVAEALDDKTERLMSVFEGNLDDNLATIHMLINERSSFTATLTAVERLHQKVELISDIASKTRMLSFNAQIEAARANEAGSGFDVIAKEIRDLSVQTRNATTDISTLIQETYTTIKDFIGDKSEEQRLQAQLDSAQEMKQHLTMLTGHHHEFGEFVKRLTTQAESDSAEIEDGILRALAELQFQDICRQQLESMTSAFDAAQKALEASNAAARSAALDEVLGGLREKYVMEKQREAHSRATGTGTSPSDAGPAIELF